MYQHEVRDSLLSKLQTFSLSDTALRRAVADQRTELPFSDIKEIRLTTYPNSGARHAQAVVRGQSGSTLKIRSHHYEGLKDFESRAASYEPLVRELIARVAAANPAARFQTGSNVMRITWMGMLAVFVVLAVLLGGLLISGEDLKGDVLGGFVLAVVSIPYAWRSMNSSRTRVFVSDAIPDEMFEI